MSVSTDQLMTKFCNIIMPGHDNKKGYINVKKKIENMGYDRRTYYNWKNKQSLPRLRTMIEELSKRGYELQIIQKDIYND